jgi:hypothetical protein
LCELEILASAAARNQTFFVAKKKKKKNAGFLFLLQSVQHNPERGKAFTI